MVKGGSNTVKRQWICSARPRTGVANQPYFLPWLGYFSKLAFADIFVVLDNVHFTKRHYLDRTQIINMHGEMQWLSLPVGQNLAVPIRDVRLHPPDDRFLPNLLQTLHTSYATAKHLDAEWGFVESLLRSVLLAERFSLLEINMAIIISVLRHLEVPAPEIISATELSMSEDPTTRIAEICHEARIARLVVGSGNSRNVHDFREIESRGIRCFIQDYPALHPTYSQARRRRRGFVAGLSIVDALFNAGTLQVREFISDNRFEPTPLQNFDRIPREGGTDEARV